MSASKPNPMSSRGFDCPKCGGQKMFVRSVLEPKPGLIVRSRKCRDCNHEMETEERLAKGRTPPAAS